VIGRNRVVITGIGVLAANGIGKDAFWKSLLAGESGIGPVTLFDASEIPNAVVGEVVNFNPEDFVGKAYKPKRMARSTQLALAATQLALADADLQESAKKSIIPISMGVSTSATEVIESQVLRINEKGVRYASPLTAITSLPQACAGSIATVLELKTQAITVSTGCPAGLDAIAHACDYIRSGKSDVALAGGTDAPITKLTLATFNAANMIPTSHRHPEKASRPFDQQRDGGVIAEGACILVLESLEHALDRGGKLYLEITGYGCAGDLPSELPGSGLRSSMEQAINNSGLTPDQIDYISAHGPSDVHLDQVETDMIKSLFGQHSYNIPVSSIKGCTGNPLAAAGPMQATVCALAFQKGVIPPTANYEVPDPFCDLDYVPVQRNADINTAIINNHGFGGSNSSLVVRRVLP
jgi:3-oxoacyl-[acyl-carrier-protein] synthase II